MADNHAHQVLVVDGDENNASVITDCLESECLVVETVTTADQALSLIEDTRFDLVLLDASIRKSDDYDVLRAIRARHTMAELPVLMLTGPSELDRVIAAMELGANDHVTIPFKAPILVARVQAQLNLLDATERLERADRALQEQANHLHVLMDSATIAIFALDGDGRFTSANQMTAEVAGTAVADLVGAPFTSLVVDEHRGEIEGLLEKVTSDGYFVTNHEFELRRSDDSRRRVVLSLRALFHGSEITGVAGIANDITALWRQREQITAYIDTLVSPDPKLLSFLDPSGGEATTESKPKADVAVAKGDTPPIAEMGKQEHRAHPRHKIYKGGKISFNNESSVVDCIVRNQSFGGARLEFQSHFDCPRFIVLRISGGPVYNCEVRQFANTIMGVKYLGKYIRA